MTTLLSVLRNVSLSLTLLAGAPALAFDVGCARTPQLAVRITHAVATKQMSLQEDGYRVQSMRYDPVLDRQWAVIAICGHPERPTFSVPVDSPAADRSENALRGKAVIRDQRAAVVHAGDLVQAWQQEPNLRIEVAGRAEESGIIGSHVRVRVLHSGFESGQPLTVTGIVRGPGNVEIAQ
jgi:hypothetical protein